MLETIKKEISKKDNTTFSEVWIDYILNVQEFNLLLELEYIKKHNEIDIKHLDKLIASLFNEVSEKW